MQNRFRAIGKDLVFEILFRQEADEKLDEEFSGCEAARMIWDLAELVTLNVEAVMDSWQIVGIRE